MGFTTGFLSGTALTLSITYLAMSAHARNRTTQAAILRQQTDTLNAIVDPVIREELRLARDHAAVVRREVPAGVGETVKDMWNSRLTEEVRRLQATDWRRVIDRAEGVLWRGVERVRSATQDGGDGKSAEKK